MESEINKPLDIKCDYCHKVLDSTNGDPRKDLVVRAYHTGEILHQAKVCARCLYINDNALE
jgi:hypothetical protein